MDGGLDIKVLTDQEKQSSGSGGQLQAAEPWGINLDGYRLG